MVRVYRGQAVSPLGLEGGGSTLIAINYQRAWINLLSIVPLLLVSGWAVVTYLVGIRTLGSLVKFILWQRGLPPFEAAGDGGLDRKAQLQARVVELGSWILFLAVSAYFLGL